MPKGPTSLSAQLQVTLPMSSFPSVVSPNFHPLLSLLLGPLPGIYYICAIPSPQPNLPFPAFPGQGRGHAGASVLRLLYTTDFLYIFNFAAT